jgi:glycerol-3-phosphate cytidylyltransferase
MTKRIGFVASAFDLLHAGHVLMLEDARSQCDYLIAGLQTDPTIDRPHSKSKPVQSMFERYIQLRGCKFVDEIIPYDTEDDLYTILVTNKIDIRILGSDYENRVDFTGSYLPIEKYFHQRHHDLSSSELRRRINNSADA